MANQVRGYVIAQTLEFIRTRCSPRAGEELESSLSPALQAALTRLSPVDWAPREHLVELLNVVAGSAHGEAERYDVLASLGRYLSERTHNEFTSLLLGILTPELLAKKFPKLWQREHRGQARLELDPEGNRPGRARLRLVGVEGYDHVGAVWSGWLDSVFRQVHPGRFELKQNGWTAATPGPTAVQYELGWS